MTQRKKISNRNKAPLKTLKQQAFGPAAEEFGNSIAPLGKDAGEVAVLVGTRLLNGVRNVVYGVDIISEWLLSAIASRLKDLSKNKIVDPNPRVAVPAVQALTYSINDAIIREMFANLLAADMNADRKSKAHPAFVELIKEMTAIDAKVLKTFQNETQVEFRIQIVEPDLNKSLDIGRNVSFELADMTLPNCLESLNNLQRLGLMERRTTESPISDRIAKEELQVRSQLTEWIALLSDPEWRKQRGLTPRADLRVTKYGLYLTLLGTNFVEVCLN